MFSRKRLFTLIPALLLIPLLVGMIPLKLANKLAHEGPYTKCQDRQGCDHKNCPAHSLISQNRFDGITVDSTTPDQEPSYLQKAFLIGPESFHSNISLTSIPLRC